jgi:hypothetical protein
MMLSVMKSVLAALFVLIGLYMAAHGDSWAPATFKLLAEPEPGAWLEHFIAFLPIFLIGIGATVYVWDRK